MKAHRWVTALALAAAVVAACAWRARSPGPPGEAPGLSGAAPRRIASLTLASDEVLAELVPFDRVACVTRLADDREISNVSGIYPSGIPRLQAASVEKVLAMKPDLVCVASYNSADFLTVIEHAGLTVFRSPDCRTMDEIEDSILNLGRHVGKPLRARQVVDRMRDRRQRLAERLRGAAERPRVLFWSAGFTAGRKTTINDIIRESGGRNVAAENGLEGSTAIAPEQVIAADPDYVLLCEWSTDEREGQIKNHPLLRNLKAVRENRVIAVQGRYLTAVSHFVVEGAERLAHVLHRDCFDSDR